MDTTGTKTKRKRVSNPVDVEKAVEVLPSQYQQSQVARILLDQMMNELEDDEDSKLSQVVQMLKTKRRQALLALTPEKLAAAPAKDIIQIVKGINDTLIDMDAELFRLNKEAKDINQSDKNEVKKFNELLAKTLRSRKAVPDDGRGSQSQD